MCCFCFLFDFWLSESGKLCVCCAFGSVWNSARRRCAIENPIQHPFPPCRFYFWLSSNLFEPLKGVEFPSTPVLRLLLPTLLFHLYRLHILCIYTVVCFHCSDGKDGGEDSSILLRWTNCALYIDSIWVVNPVRKKGRERKEEGIL